MRLFTGSPLRGRSVLHRQERAAPRGLLPVAGGPAVLGDGAQVVLLLRVVARVPVMMASVMMASVMMASVMMASVMMVVPVAPAVAGVVRRVRAPAVAVRRMVVAVAAAGVVGTVVGMVVLLALVLPTLLWAGHR